MRVSSVNFNQNTNSNNKNQNVNFGMKITRHIADSLIHKYVLSNETGGIWIEILENFASSLEKGEQLKDNLLLQDIVQRGNKTIAKITKDRTIPYKEIGFQNSGIMFIEKFAKHLDDVNGKPKSNKAKPNRNFSERLADIGYRLIKLSV